MNSTGSSHRATQPRHAADALCCAPRAADGERYTDESLDYDPTEAVGKIDGFRRSKTCKGLRLEGGECDSVHIFWNHKTKRLAWWRS